MLSSEACRAAPTDDCVSACSASVAHPACTAASTSELETKSAKARFDRFMAATPAGQANARVRGCHRHFAAPRQRFICNAAPKPAGPTTPSAGAPMARYRQRHPAQGARAHVRSVLHDQRVGDGTGLGLALVHGIVADFGGRIDVATRVGTGTTFTIWLPAAGEIPVLLAEPPSELPLGYGETVMIVDDE